MENLKTFKADFANPTHNLQPISTAEEFALEQLKHSLAQAEFWLGVAQEWAKETPQDEQFSTDLADAIHYTGVSQQRVSE